MSTTGEREMSDRMGALEIAMATLGATLTTKLDALMTAVDRQRLDHETRLRALEARPTQDRAVQQLAAQVTELQTRCSRLERGWYVLLGAAIVFGGTAGALVPPIVP